MTEIYSDNSGEYEHDAGESLRCDTYDYIYFSPEDFPLGAMLAQQIQAQSYVNMRIVRPEGLITLPGGAPVISPDVSSPLGTPHEAPLGSRAEIALGKEKGSNDLSPITGRLVTWKKFYASLEDLPAYQFSKDGLWPDGERDLRQADAHHNLVLVEPEALGKTINAGPGAVKEFMRAEIQRVLGRGEIWFMGLVEGTAYESFVHNWGQKAVRRIGASRCLEHPYNYDNVALVPTILDVDNFFANMMGDILTPGNESAVRQMANFIYMTEGVRDVQLGEEVAEFRAFARQVFRGEDENQ